MVSTVESVQSAKKYLDDGPWLRMGNELYGQSPTDFDLYIKANKSHREKEILDQWKTKIKLYPLK